MSFTHFLLEMRPHHLVDWIVAAALVLVSIAALQLLEPHCRSFDWYDASINYKGGTDTVPNYSLFLLLGLAAVFLVLFSAFGNKVLRRYIPAYSKVVPCPLSDHRIGSSGATSPSFLLNREWNIKGCAYAYSWLAALAYSFVLSFFCVSVLKLYAGRLRPDYLWRLEQHGYTSSTTVDPLTGESLPNPHTNPQYYCHLMKTISSSPSLKEGRMSFPSGHSSSSFATMGIVSLFLFAHFRPFSFRGSFTRLIISVSPLWLALFISVSRTRDNKHNFSDVISGAMIGATSSIISFFLCFRITGGAAMIVLERGDDDVEYLLQDRWAKQVLTLESSVAAGDSALPRPTSQYTGNKDGVSNANPISTEKEQNQLELSGLAASDADKKLFNRLESETETEAVHLRGLNQDRNIGLPSNGLMFVTERRLNESSQAVPWI